MCKNKKSAKYKIQIGKNICKIIDTEFVAIKSRNLMTGSRNKYRFSRVTVK